MGLNSEEAAVGSTGVRQALPPEVAARLVDIVSTWRGELELHFSSSSAAEQHLPAVAEWAKSTAAGAFACLHYNERAYADRGWCCFEEAVAVEVAGRSQMPGFEHVREALDALPIAKVRIRYADPMLANPC